MNPSTRLVRYPASLQGPSDTVVAVGNFDGVHLGHRKVIDALLAQRTDSRPAVLVSFYPHPAVVLGKRKEQLLLTSLREKWALLSQKGLDYLYLVHFTPRFSQMRAADFVQDVLLSKLSASHLIFGPDTAFGYRREGDIEFLSQYCTERNVSFEVVSPHEVTSERVSSGKIRELLKTGDIRHANDLLGRAYGVSALVVAGDSRGQTLGFPTANLAPTLQMLPRHGVYAVHAEVEGAVFEGIANVGVRPTFGSDFANIEVHLFSDQKLDLYGKRAHVTFLTFVREERKFDGVPQLKEQIARDIERVKKFFLESVGD